LANLNSEKLEKMLQDFYNLANDMSWNELTDKQKMVFAILDGTYLCDKCKTSLIQ
jgi:hypothetical protein